MLTEHSGVCNVQALTEVHGSTLACYAVVHSQCAGVQVTKKRYRHSSISVALNHLFFFEHLGPQALERGLLDFALRSDGRGHCHDDCHVQAHTSP